MSNHQAPDCVLTVQTKQQILNRVLKALEQKFYKPELLSSRWREAVEHRRPMIEGAFTQELFEQEMSALLQTLGASHLGFFHATGRRASSRAALSATYIPDETPFGQRWVFQDVHDGGAAALADVEPGNVLLRVNGKDVTPPEHPVFPMGSISEVNVLGNDNQERTVSVAVARPKGKKLHFVEPTLVQSRRMAANLGYLKVAMFPGMLGVEVANAMSEAITGLGQVHGLIVDLRGNTGGGAGALRLMSILTPSRVPVGFALGKKWIGRELAAVKNGFPRLNRIPARKRGLWLLGAKFLPALLMKSPVVLETEGLGGMPFHGHVVILVDRHTASAAEMVTIFAKENGLATIVGERTAGRLLSATSVKVGRGFRLALPTGSYHTWNGTVLEGIPIEPHLLIPFDPRERRTGVDHQLDMAIDSLVECASESRPGPARSAVLAP